MYELLIFYAVAIFIVLGISAIYSVAETSITSIPPVELQRLKMEKVPQIKTIEKLRKEKEMFLGTLLIASTALDTFASALAISFSIQVGGVEWIPVATAFATVAIVLFADILPKTYAFEHPAKSAIAVARFVLISVKILYPITKVVQFIVRWIFKVFRVKAKRVSKTSGDMMLRGAIDMGYSMGYLLNYKKQMLDGILDLSKFTVKQIMTKYNKVYSFDIDTKPEKLLKSMLKTGHSRFPIWKNNAKNIIGMLYIKDLFDLTYAKATKDIKPKDIEAVMYDPWFVDSSTSLINQLKEFRKRKIHFAIVVNNKGENVGIISLEDILEEIVGNIDDEHDFGSDYINQTNNKCIIKGSIPIKELNQQLGLDLPGDEFIVFSKLLSKHADKAPKVGDKIKVNNVQFKISKIMGKKISEVTVEQ
ncbi:MAG: CNNM domain-containing protein [Rickettsiales bacterium]